ncbi:hypothetical protein M2451_002561 [Dysgonomonas sp. PFB1-18]|nr:MULTISPECIES: hypothetical protein [unclassified Dysgonomonas]MDH6308042.1 hypothetical protein [Dysgonomonas sp. PF1-14]MDH6339581.1 hypothetical protein [Dysgonomonas sp. PF1-16]MDH6381232.1 hypothetical protein [Dysgonomonas sp. PFB1-18]MDH6398444.1 hypothetical protein [Dysgonomonas sp. PF1-23]
MIQDAARIKDDPKEGDEDDGGAGSGEVIHQELKTKEDIKNHLKGLM